MRVYMIYQPQTKQYWQRGLGLTWIGMKDGTILTNRATADTTRKAILQAYAIEVEIQTFTLERV